MSTPPLEELTQDQRNTLLLLSVLHPNSAWHLNACGCCVCLHPGSDTEQGYIINSDGDSFLYTAEDLALEHERLAKEAEER